MAAKYIKKENLVKKSSQKKLANEIKAHESLEHPHIVKFHRHFNDKNFVYLLLSLCEHGTLSSVLKQRKKLMEFEVVYYIS